MEMTLSKRSCFSHIIVLMIIMSFTISADGDEFSAQIRQLCMQMANGVSWQEGKRLSVAIGSFTYLDSKMASPFGLFLVNELDSTLASDKRFKLISRKELGEILKEHKIQLEDIINPATTVGLGNIEGVQAILTGTYGEWGNDIRLSASLIAVRTGEKLASASATLKDIPSNVKVKPENYEKKKEEIDLISNLLPEEDRQNVAIPERNSDFNVRVWSDRGNGGIYKSGESMKIYLKSDKDCYVEIYDIYPNGEIHLIFPNAYDKENFIKANRLYEFPRDDSYKFEVAPPFGVEALKVVASTVSFSNISEIDFRSRGAFPELGNVQDRFTIKGIQERVRGVTVKPNAELAQNLCVFTTVP